MMEREVQFIEERGPEKWLREVPVETFGTEKERQENFERFSKELRVERDKRGISEEEYSRRLESAKSFLRDIPLIHITSFASLEIILSSGKILSTLEIENKDIKKFKKSNTFGNDQKAGLDQFIFMSLGNAVIGGAAIVLNNRILERPDCFFTAEDIVDVPKRLLDLGLGWPKSDWRFLKNEKYPSFFAEVLKEYKKQVLSGKDFKGFLADFIATYHASPQEYVGFPDSNDYKKEWSIFYYPFWAGDKRSERQPLFPRSWYNPEVKVMKEIGVDDIRFIIVSNIETAQSLSRIYKIPLNKIKTQKYITSATMKELWEDCGYDFSSE